MNRTSSDFAPLPVGTTVTVSVATGTIRATILDADVLPSGQAVYFVRDMVGRQFPANAELVAARRA